MWKDGRVRGRSGPLYKPKNGRYRLSFEIFLSESNPIR